MTAGLLEKFYKQREDVMFLKKREYLLERESYLDAQLNGYGCDKRTKEEKNLDLILAFNQVDDKLLYYFMLPNRSIGSFHMTNNSSNFENGKKNRRLIFNPVIAQKISVFFSS